MDATNHRAVAVYGVKNNQNSIDTTAFIVQIVCYEKKSDVAAYYFEHLLLRLRLKYLFDWRLLDLSQLIFLKMKIS